MDSCGIRKSYQHGKCARVQEVGEASKLCLAQQARYRDLLGADDGFHQRRRFEDALFPSDVI